MNTVMNLRVPLNSGNPRLAEELFASQEDCFLQIAIPTIRMDYELFFITRLHCTKVEDHSTGPRD
jgi:hypothetical protein